MSCLSAVYFKLLFGGTQRTEDVLVLSAVNATTGNWKYTADNLLSEHSAGGQNRALVRTQWNGSFWEISPGSGAGKL